MSLSSEKKVQKFGIHLTIDGYRGDPASLADSGVLADTLDTLVHTLEMHSLHKPVVLSVGEKNKKDPGGVSGFVMIAESHISIHTFPKRGFLSADIYTCQDTLNEEVVLEIIKRAYTLEELEVNSLSRGTRYPVENIY